MSLLNPADGVHLYLSFVVVDAVVVTESSCTAIPQIVVLSALAFTVYGVTVIITSSDEVQPVGVVTVNLYVVVTLGLASGFNIVSLFNMTVP